MKLVIIIVVIVVLLLGGGGAWYFLFRDVDATPKKEVVMPPDPIFVKMDPLNMDVIRGGVVQKYIVLKMTLEMRDEESEKIAENNMAKIRDVFISAINEYYANLPSLKDPVNVKAVKSRLLEASARAIGEGRVKSVLIQGVFEHKGNEK